MTPLQTPRLRPGRRYDRWVVRRTFGPHPAADLNEPLPRWWTGTVNEFGEPEDAEVFDRKIDAEAAYRTEHGRLDKRTRAQKLAEALAEVAGPAGSDPTPRDNAGQDAAPVVVSAGGGSS